MSRLGLGRVKTKSNLAVALSGGGFLHFFALNVTASLKIPGAVIPRDFTRPGSIATGRGKLRSSHVRNAPLATVGPKKAACRDGPLNETARAVERYAQGGGWG